jgi:hypothetical protein
MIVVEHGGAAKSQERQIDFCSGLREVSRKGCHLERPAETGLFVKKSTFLTAIGLDDTEEVPAHKWGARCSSPGHSSRTTRKRCPSMSDLDGADCR